MASFPAVPFRCAPACHMALLVALLPGSRLHAEPRLAVLADRPPLETEIVSLSPQGELVIESDRRQRRIDVRELASWGAAAEARQGPQLLLAGGGLLAAYVVKSDNDMLHIDSPLFGEAALPLENLAGVLFYPPADRQQRDRLEFRVRDAKGDADRLILDNGDELTGTLASVEDRTVELKSNVGKVKIETARIAALVFNPELREEPIDKGLRFWCGFRDGSRLLAAGVTIRDDRVRVEAAGGAKLSADCEELVFLLPLGGRVTYLSDLKSTGYRHVPFLKLPWSWQADRNVLGTRLRAGEQLYLKGIGMHSASRLSFPLDGRYRRFEAELAIDSATGGRGSVVFRVYFDTEQKYASPIIRGGDWPLPVSLDIPSSARTLSLIVDFAERGDEQDHANWLHARLAE